MERGSNSFNIINLPYAPVQVKGRVTDEGGQGIQGVTIKVKNGTEATLTDANGRFSINIKTPQSTLVFTAVGYQKVEKAINNDTFIDIVMKKVTTDLNEVVITGYGTTIKKDVITAIGTANVKDMQKAPVPSFDQMLAGRIAGVSVTSSDGQPGAAASITVRGGSVSQDSSPLFVIDGIAIENIDINSINPRDIESFQVLKDPASVAIYGSRGSNGVILVTTKKGKAGTPRINYGYNRNYQKIVKRIPLMNPYQFVKLQLELDSIASTPGNPVNTFHNLYLDPSKGIDLNYYKTVQGNDWQDLLFKTANTETHSLNLSGGSNDMHYYVSGGAYRQDGILLNTGLKRYDGRIALDQKISKNVKVGISGSYSNSTAFGTIAVNGNGGGIIQDIWQYRPVSGVGNQNLINTLVDSAALASFYSGNGTATLGDNLINPLKQVQNEYRKTISNASYLNTFLDYNFAKKFILHLSGNYNSTIIRLDNFYNSQTQQGNLFKNAAGATPNTNGINGQSQTSNAQTYSTSNTLTYNTAIGKHNINGLVGVEYNYSKQASTNLRAINIPQIVESLGIISLGSGTPAAASLGTTRNQLYSAFSRINYNYAGKYYLMGSVREDASSKFSPGKQYGIFPSVAAAWTLSEEKFFKNIDRNVIDFAKVRVSWGNTGNNRVGDYSYLATLNQGYSSGYPFNNVNFVGILPFQYGNSNITWETTTGTDVGLNMELLKGRISFDADYYEKNTKGFLIAVRLPYSAAYPNGANAQYQNTGKLSNSGFEFTLNTVNIQSKNFTWTSNFNIAFNNSKILELYNGIDNIQTSWGLSGSAGTTAWIAKVGGPISQFYGYVFDGLYQYADFNKLANGSYVLKSGMSTYASNVQPGDAKYKDINGDGVVNADDVTTLGSPLPIHTGGFSNNFTYKNFSLNIFLQWSYGNKVLNANTIAFESTGGYFAYANQYAAYDNRWTPSNQDTDIPKARANTKGDAGTTGARVSSRIIENGSYLRLKTVQLAYNLPKSILSKLKITNLQLTASAQNLFTFTKYSGMDPEVSTYRYSNPSNSPFGGNQTSSTAAGGAGYTFIQPTSGYASLAGGYDFTPYPRALIINLGATVTF